MTPPHTRTESRYWVGVDPGGKRRYGVAVLEDSELILTTTVDCTDDAIEAVTSLLSSLSGAPAGVGIDAPMWWSSACSGDRLADQTLRRSHKLSGGEVQAANSLRGAALIQGMMFAQCIRAIYPNVPITEAHPKALVKAMRETPEGSFEDRYGIALPSNEHIRDAIVSAIAAREGVLERWSIDLSKHRHPSEQDPRAYWLAPISYFWPAI